MTIPKEDFVSYNAKFNHRCGKDWLILGSIYNIFLWNKALQVTLQRGTCLKTQVSKYNSHQVEHPCFVHYKKSLYNCMLSDAIIV